MAKSQITRRLRMGRAIALVVGVVLLVGGVILLHIFQVRRQAGSLLDRADAAAEKAAWSEAVSLYQSYLQFRPEDASAVARYADAMEGVAATRPAVLRQVVLVYEQLLRLDDRQSERRRRLARHYLNLGLLAACRSHLKLLMADPDAQAEAGDLHEMFAACEERERKFDTAADHYRKAIATGKATTEGRLRFALMLYELVRTEEARTEAAVVMDKLVDEDPRATDRRLARGRFRAAAGNTRLAREDVEYAYRSIPGGATNPNVVLALADLASGDGDYATASAVLTEAAGKVDDGRIRIALANVQIQLDDPDAAVATLKAASASFAGPDLLLAEIAERLIDLGDLGTATVHSERFAADTRFRALADYLMARVRLAEGNWPEAAKKIRTALESGLNRYPAQHVNAFLTLAECYRMANNPDQRLKAATEALALDSTSARAGLARAESLVAVGKKSEAMTVYAGLLGTARRKDDRDAARLALCQLKLADVLEQRDGERNFAVFDDLIGPPPHTAELFLVRVSVLVAQNRITDALAELEAAAAKSQGAAGVWVALALTQSGQGTPADGLAALDRAGRAAVDKVDFRLTRAQLLAQTRPVDTAAIRALAEDIGSFGKADRYRLAYSLGGLMAGLGRRADAIELYRRAAAEMPYDLASRLALFDLAVAENNSTLRDDALGQIRAIEGDDGPTTLVAEATRDLVAVKPGDTAGTAAIRPKVLRAGAVRENWGRIHALLGDLDLLDGHGDAALDHYRRAVESGDQNVAVVRTFTRLLLDRSGHHEALDTLARLSRSMVLPSDLASQLMSLRAVFGEDRSRTLAWAKSPVAAASRSYHDHLVRANVFAVAGDSAAARAALQSAAGLRPESAEVWVALVRHLAANGMSKESAAAVDQAQAKARPDTDTPAGRAALAVALGSCREMLGDAPAAEARYRDAVAADATSIPAHQRLASLLYRSNRRGDADALLTKLAADSPVAEVRRWARREHALALVARPDGYAALPTALALVEKNLADGNLLEDQRAKALVLAADPFRRDEAIALLTTSRSVPLTPDQGALLGQLQMQAGRFDLAEIALRDATRATHLVAPEHIALLARVQLERGNSSGARDTVERLRAAAPNSWLATAAHCRVLAAQGQGAAAESLLVDMVRKADPTALATRIGPLLEELKAVSAARDAFERSMAGNSSPVAHVPLAQFFVRSGDPASAVKLAFQFAATAPMGATARLLAGAARSRPPQLTPPAAKADWEPILTRVDEWVLAKHREHPADLEVLFAKAELDDLFGRFDDALATYARGLTASPGHPILLNNHAVLLAMHKKDLPTALDEVEQVIRAHGPRATLLDSRGVIHLAADRWADAERDLRAAASLDPKPVYMFHLALALHRQSPDNRSLADQRDRVLSLARTAGLTKPMLHPKEWADYDAMVRTP